MKGKMMITKFYGYIQNEQGNWHEVEIPQDITIEEMRIMGIEDVEKVEYPSASDTLRETFQKTADSLQEFFEDMNNLHEVNKTTDEA